VWRERGGFFEARDFDRLLILHQPAKLPKPALNAIRLTALGVEWRRKIAAYLLPSSLRQLWANEKPRSRSSTMRYRRLARAATRATVAPGRHSGKSALDLYDDHRTLESGRAKKDPNPLANSGDVRL
jgi:hypothetical protein